MYRRWFPDSGISGLLVVVVLVVVVGEVFRVVSGVLVVIAALGVVREDEVGVVLRGVVRVVGTVEDLGADRLSVLCTRLADGGVVVTAGGGRC